jgi:hypothetical protein
LLSLDELNPWSRRFAERLLAAHPEWRSLGRRDPEGSPPPASLLLDVPSPVAGRALMIRTDGDQVTVDFGPRGWHDHFGSSSGQTEDAAFAAALAFIDDLMAERVVIVTRVLFGRPLWSRAVEATRLRRPLVGRVEVCSWTGRGDGMLIRR